jgi:DNA-binding ferritin-like protein
MALKSLFPQDMLNSSSMGNSLNLDGIAAKLTHFVDQLHLLHWQTTSYAEHQALGGLYDKVFDYKDDIVEKIMGYTGTRPKATKHDMLRDYSIGLPKSVVIDLKSFAKELEEYAEANNMPDIENIAQGLSGDAAKTLYLLTLS